MRIVVFLRLLAMTLLLLPAPGTGHAETDALETAIRPLEEPRMARLAQLQRRLPVPLRDFESDGCSGGLSSGWSLLTRQIPELAGRLGERPPWEPCCVEHDRAYWRGQGENGYTRRLAADRALRQCVLTTAEANREDWATRLGISPVQLDELMTGVAQSMYLAVRVAGGPCTGLDWRWGYGWPDCGNTNPAGEGGVIGVQWRITRGHRQTRIPDLSHRRTSLPIPVFADNAQSALPSP